MKSLTAEPVTAPSSHLLLIWAQRLRQALCRQQGPARFCRATQFQKRTTASIRPCKSPEMAPGCKAEPKGSMHILTAFWTASLGIWATLRDIEQMPTGILHLMITPSKVFRTHIFVKLIKPRNHLLFASFWEEGNKRQTASVCPWGHWIPFYNYLTGKVGTSSDCCLQYTITRLMKQLLTFSARAECVLWEFHYRP